MRQGKTHPWIVLLSTFAMYLVRLLFNSAGRRGACCRLQTGRSALADLLTHKHWQQIQVNPEDLYSLRTDVETSMVQICVC